MLTAACQPETQSAAADVLPLFSRSVKHLCFPLRQRSPPFCRGRHVHALRIARRRGNYSSRVPNAESFPPAYPQRVLRLLQCRRHCRRVSQCNGSRGARSSSRRGERSKMIKRILCRFSIHASRPGPAPSLRRHSFHARHRMCSPEPKHEQSENKKNYSANHVKADIAN